MRNNGDDGYSQFGYEHEEISFFERAEMEQFDASYADTYSNEIVVFGCLKQYFNTPKIISLTKKLN